jgi:pimeloyl-ACP methyl ester carboxylesterase
MRKILLFAFVLLAQQIMAQLDGKWYSSFVIMGSAQRIDMNVITDEKGTTVDLIFPDLDSAKTHKTDKVLISDSTLEFSWTKRALDVKSKYYPDGDTLFAELSQNGLKWNVTFFRTKQPKKEVHRPQEPKPPFNYLTKEVIIQNGDIQLGATITYPELTDGKMIPFVVLASGSGPQNRDCELMGHKPFWVIADHLSRNGIAVLRFDDRGTGKSTGVYQTSNLEDFASDVNACVNYLAKDPVFSKHAIIGIAGHSEGGMHALMTAKKNKKVKFLIELASVGTSGREVLIEQQYLIPLKAGSSKEYSAWNSRLYAGMCRIISKYSAEETQAPLFSFVDSMYAIAPEEVKKETSAMTLKMQLMMFGNNEWMRQFVKFESKDYLKKIKVPVLAINGGEDIQVPAESSLDGFDRYLSKKSQVQSKLIYADGLNHLFQTCKICTVMEYADLEETFNEKAMNDMLEWISSLKLD